MKHVYTGKAIMPITAYFNRVFTVHRQAEALKERIAALKEEQAETDIPELNTAIGEAIDGYVTKYKELLDFQGEIERLINTVELEARRHCLFERYMNLKSWDKIAQDNFYAHAATPNKLARKGLKDIARNNPQFSNE